MTAPQHGGAAAAYYRVSSKAQGLEMQQTAVERAAAAAGDAITVVYSEKRSAKVLARPELDRLRADARAGRLPRQLYVFRFDRLCRSGIRDFLNLLDELRAAGVTVISVTDGFTLEGPPGELLMAGIAFAAQLERVAGEDRRAAARERREAAGLPFGRPPKIPRELHEEILRLAAEPRSSRAIATALKVKKSTVDRWRKRPLDPPEGVPKVSMKTGAGALSEEAPAAGGVP